MIAKPKRIRRTAEEARRVILDAAEKRLAENGPEGIRLQDIANDIGISHPTILHHFENRDGLVLALARRGAEQLSASLMTAFSSNDGAGRDMHAIMDRVYEVLAERGHSRLVGWMVLGGIWRDDPNRVGFLQELTDVIQTLREKDAKQAGDPPPSRDETEFLTMLGAIAALGDGLFGSVVRRAAGHPDDAEHARKFRDQFADMLQNLLRAPNGAGTGTTAI